MFFADKSIESTTVSDLVKDKESSDAAVTGQSTQAVARILIVDEHPSLRSALTDLVDKAIGYGSCLQANSAEQAARTLQSQRVDFAIVNVPVRCCRGPHLAEKIKLHCPAIPILTVSVKPKEALHDGTTELKHPQHIDPLTAERIVAGVRYIQSLSRSGVSGFVVVVKE